MMTSPSLERENHLISGLVLGLATIIAAVSCADQASSWNDGSRLSMVEAIVDHHTFVIDDSIFVKPTPNANPYDPESQVAKTGTMDKIYINGHYYSDKSPVQPVLMAGAYRLIQALTGMTASESPRAFCMSMTLLSSGLAYVLAVWCTYLLGRPLRLSMPARLWLTLAMAVSTLAPVYLQYVNNHLFQLGVAMPLMLGMAWLVEKQEREESLWALLIGLGLLTGLGYGIDLGVGPVLLMCMGIYILFRCRKPGQVIVFGLACLPGLIAHHWMNYAIGGTWKPANSVPEYFLWPGCPFNTENLTGMWKHDSVFGFIKYMLAILFGKKGFFGYNLVLFLTIPGIVVLLRSRMREKPEILFCLAWSVGTWLLYGAASNNYSGQCYSIRWFLPLLAPGFFVLALLLRVRPTWLSHLQVFTAGGFLLVIWMWITGPWVSKMIVYFWPVQALCFLGCYWLNRRVKPKLAEVEELSEERLAA